MNKCEAEYASRKMPKEIETMPETIKIVLMILFVIGALFLMLRITGWKMKRACDYIIRDLKEKKAFDPASSVALPYTKSPMINFVRDYRPRALEELQKNDVIRLLEGGRYYLREGHKLSGMDDRTAAPAKGRKAGTK
jgi:hypothetical protein